MSLEVSENSIVAMIVRYTHDGQENLNTFHYKVRTLGGVGLSVTEVNSGVEYCWTVIGGLKERFQDCLSVDIVDCEVWSQVIALQRFPKKLAVGAFSGTVAGTALPSNLSHALTLRGEFAGPRYRGTKHIGGQASSFSSQSLLTPAGLGALMTLGDGLVMDQDGDAGGDTTFYPVIYNRADPGASIAIKDYLVGSTTRVQRRRTVGLGT